MTHYSRLTAMGEMASALAHELNQPLSAIANYLRGLERAADGPVPLDDQTRKAITSKAVELTERGLKVFRLHSGLLSALSAQLNLS